MDAVRQEAIRKQIIQSIEDQVEALSFEAKICNKIHDEKGLENVKARLVELEKKLEAATSLIKEQ
jgi:hypothetical protein